MEYFKIDQKQYDALLGLRFCISSIHKIRERETDKKQAQYDIDLCHKTITGSCFPELDALGVPFWVQNIVCVKAEDWRHTAETYLYQDLEKRNVDCSQVSVR